MPALRQTSSLPVSASTPSHPPPSPHPNPETPSDERDTLKKLIQMNSDYLNQKVKVAEVPKPSPFTYKLPSKTGNSEYTRNYKSANRNHNIDSSPSKPAKPICQIKVSDTPVPQYASTYALDYSRKRIQTEGAEVSFPSQRKKEKYQPSDAPSFNETSYKRDFANKGTAHAQSAKRAEVKLMGGGKLSCDTTYGHSFRVKTVDSEVTPVKHKNNNIFVKVEKPAWSSYQESFRQRKRNKIQQSCKPKQQYVPLASNCKYQTEYAGVFKATPVGARKDFNCLTPNELKQYVMGILD